MREYINIIEHALSESRRSYTGQPLETGGTSIKGQGAAPPIKWLYSKGHITNDMKVLDYGAGKFGRNSDWLREQGLEVYAYDPFNGTDSNGWEGVSTIKPTDTFDVAFSSYVLNVVPEHIENDIIKEMRQLSKHTVHVTRNMDIYDTVVKALSRGDKLVTEFFKKEYADAVLIDKLENDELTKDDVVDFCHFGVQTTRGFQRIPVLEDKGYRLIRKANGYKIYIS